MKFKAKYILIFISGLITGFLLVAIISSRKIDSVAIPSEVSKNENKPQYKWYLPQVPTSLSFCGEEVPLDRWEVSEKLERELITNVYQHGAILYELALAGRYFPIIEQRLKENNAPDDLKYVCVAESSLHQNAVSAVGATSFWQFMKDTGPRYGLEINDEIDDRFNLAKATDAACRYFNEAYTKFGSWTAATASYNCGQTGYNNQVEFQQASNFYDLIFNDETNRYVFRILAIKTVLSNAKKYGFMVDSNDQFKPLKFRTVTVEKSIANLNDFAHENNTTYKMLKIFNPWLRAHKLTVKPGKKYDIALPL